MALVARAAAGVTALLLLLFHTISLRFRFHLVDTHLADRWHVPKPRRNKIFFIDFCERPQVHLIY